MKTKHTSGQWHFRTGDSDNFCEIIGDFGTSKCIAVTPKDCFVNKDEAEANGRLIAAAPDLLNAISGLVEKLSPYIYKLGVKKGFSELVALEEARKAIRKATE